MSDSEKASDQLFVRSPGEWLEDDSKAVKWLREATADVHLDPGDFVLLTQNVKDFNSIGPWDDSKASFVSMGHEFVPHPDVTASTAALTGMVVTAGFCTILHDSIPVSLVDLILQVVNRPSDHVMVYGYITEDGEFYTTGIIACPHPVLYPSTLN